jgi:DNA-binding MarR family transcriptional regulator
MSFHYLLMANQAMVQKQLLAALAGTGLTLGQPKVLDYLGEQDGANQTAIARACYIEPASLTAVLSGMEAKGLITRKMLNGNRRSLHVFLTPLGRQMQQRTAQAFQALEEKAFRGFSAREREEFERAFARVHANLTGEGEE